MISRMLRILRRAPGLPPPCHEARMLSSDYLDGELEPSLRQKIRAHLAECPACAAFVNTLKATIDLLRAASPQPIPHGYKSRILQRIREPQT